MSVGASQGSGMTTCFEVFWSRIIEISHVYVLEIQINPNDPATKCHFYTGIVELDTSKKIPCFEQVKHTIVHEVHSKTSMVIGFT